MKGRDLLHEPPIRWEGGESALLLNPRLSAEWRERVLSTDFPDESGRIWLSTSGTGGALKLVALSRGALEASARAVNAHLCADAKDVWLNPLPLFHAGGLGIIVRAAISGAQWEHCGPWSAVNFVRRADECGATLASLVPTQVFDLWRADVFAPSSLRAVVVGGGVLEESLRGRMAGRGWNLLPSYGLTEAASQVATASAGQADFTWLPLLPHIEARISGDGVLEVSGSSLLDGWLRFDPDGSARWEDPKSDGWLRTGDRAELRGRELRVSGRLDDLVKIRGELVDVGALERALQEKAPSGPVRIDVERDERNGARLVVVAGNRRALAEAEAASALFPPYAVPAGFRAGTIETTPLGKKIRVTP